MKNFIKQTLVVLLAGIIYLVGMSLYMIYFDRLDKHSWDFETIVCLALVVITVTGPVISYWEAKLLKLFGMNREKTPKE